MTRIDAGGGTAGGGGGGDDGGENQPDSSGSDSKVRRVTKRARVRQRDTTSSGRTRPRDAGGADAPNVSDTPTGEIADPPPTRTDNSAGAGSPGGAAPSASQEPAAPEAAVPSTKRTGLAVPSEQTEAAAAEQAALRSRAAAETELDESEVRSVDPSSGRVRVTAAGRERLAAEQFQEQRSQARKEALPTKAGAEGGEDIPLGEFRSDELEFDATDDGSVQVSPTDDAAERVLRQRAASQSDRFDEDDIAIVRVGQGERLEARVTQSAATREARQQLAEREGVDADDVVVRQPEPGRFVAEEREGPPVEVDVSTDAGALVDRAAGDGDAGAPLDVDASVDRDSRTGQVAAAGLAGVATPEPVSSVTGGLVAGGAVATALTVDALRRSNEVGIGEGVQRSELDVGSGGTVSELEVGAGAGATATEVEVTEPTVQEVEPGDPEATEVEIGEGSEGAAGQASDDTVVPGEYPLPGRDFPANPREDVVQRRNEPSDVLDTSAVIDQGTGTSDLPSPGETPEIGEPTIGEETGAGTGAERSFPTGSEAVVSEEITRAESASESEVTSGEETLDVSERAADAEVAGSAPGSAARSPPAAAETDDSVSTSTDIFSETLAGSAAVASSLSTDIAADTGTSTAVEDQAVGTGAETVTENVFETETATETLTETGTGTVPGFGLPTQGGPGPGPPTEGGGSTGLPFPAVPGGNAGGAGGAFEARDDEIFPSGILTGEEAFDIFFGDSDDS